MDGKEERGSQLEREMGKGGGRREGGWGDGRRGRNGCFHEHRPIRRVVEEEKCAKFSVIYKSYTHTHSHSTERDTEDTPKLQLEDSVMSFQSKLLPPRSPRQT